MHNPYLDSFLALNQNDSIQNDLYMFDRRFELVKRYSWAIPDDETIKRIAQFSPLIEIGAGTGYWANQLQLFGADIVAFDESPPNCAANNWFNSNIDLFFPVAAGGPEMINSFPENNLFLCWPPYSNSMAYDCLVRFRGEYLLYVGENDGGCCADEAFWELLSDTFNNAGFHLMPCWPFIHDNLSIWKRK